MKATPLMDCRQCGFGIPPLEKVVKKRVAAPQGVVVFVECPKCGTHQSTLLLPEELQRRAADTKSSRREDKRAREIGVLVKGFAVDLEAVENVGDLNLYWDYQESTNPGSIVVENRMWKRGK